MRKINFNSDWTFGKVGEKDIKHICLPYDAMMYEERSGDAPSGSAGGFYRGGKYVYKKTFIPGNSIGKHVLLWFEGVYGDCFVYLNGKLIAQNVYGYNGFCADLSAGLISGKENEIKVVVNNDKMINSRWYSGSGIYRGVWLYTGSDIRIERGGLKISTPEVAEDVSKAEVALNLASDKCERVKTFIQTEITDNSGKVIDKEVTPFTFFEKGNAVARQRLYLQNVKLWSVASPNLYKCVVKLISENGELLDETSEYFGVRKITADPVYGLRINGEKVALRGACIHHDNGVIGANEYYDACERRIRILKEAGFNAVRISHHPCSEDMLEACDKLGMLVWDETFDMWQEAKNKYDFSIHFGEEWKKVVDSMIDKDFNHPSVIIYSIGNEIPEIIKPEGIKLSRMLSERVREKDSTRLVSNGINGLCAVSGKVMPLLIELGIVTREQIAKVKGDPYSENTNVFNVLMQAVAGGDINDVMTALSNNIGKIMEHPSIGEKLAESSSHLDICGYNYMKSRYALDAREHPNKILVGSETTPPDIDILWNSVKNINQLVGDFTWTGWDYIGEAGVGHTNYEGKSEFAAAYPAYLAYCGDIDITGYRRPMSYLREIVFGFRTKPYVSVQNPEYFDKLAKTTSWAEPETVENWTWSGYEGKPVRVKVYSADNEIELIVNGKTVGRKKVERNRAEFETVYEEGEIEAVGYKNGKKTESHSIKTASKNLGLNISLSKTQIDVDKDLCFIEMQITDENGVKVMNADGTVKISVSDNLEIIGFGTGDPCSTENFFDSEHKTFNGRALAVIRGKEEGKAAIAVEWNGKKIIKKLSIKGNR